MGSPERDDVRLDSAARRAKVIKTGNTLVGGERGPVEETTLQEVLEVSAVDVVTLTGNLCAIAAAVLDHVLSAHFYFKKKLGSEKIG